MRLFHGLKVEITNPWYTNCESTRFSLLLLSYGCTVLTAAIGFGVGYYLQSDLLLQLITIITIIFAIVSVVFSLIGTHINTNTD